MPDAATEQTLQQIREVARWWHGDAAIEHSRQRLEGDSFAQAAAASRRQRDDWHALGDLLYAVAYPDSANLAHATKAAERLADRLDPEWRRVRVEADRDAD